MSLSLKTLKLDIIIFLSERIQNYQETEVLKGEIDRNVQF